MKLYSHRNISVLFMLLIIPFCLLSQELTTGENLLELLQNALLTGNIEPKLSDSDKNSSYNNLISIA